MTFFFFLFFLLLAKQMNFWILNFWRTNTINKRWLGIVNIQFDYKIGFHFVYRVAKWLGDFKCWLNAIENEAFNCGGLFILSVSMIFKVLCSSPSHTWAFTKAWTLYALIEKRALYSRFNHLVAPYFKYVYISDSNQAWWSRARITRTATFQKWACNTTEGMRVQDSQEEKQKQN